MHHSKNCRLHSLVAIFILIQFLFLVRAAPVYVKRVYLSGFENSPGIIDQLAEKLGNYYQVRVVDSEKIASSAKPAHVLVIRLQKKNGVEQLVHTARTLPNLNRVVIFPQTKEKEYLENLQSQINKLNQQNRSGKQGQLIVFANPGSDDALNQTKGEPKVDAESRILIQAITTKYDPSAALDDPSSLFGECNTSSFGESSPTGKLGRLHSFSKNNLRLIEPLQPRAGRPWIWIESDHLFENPTLKSWISLSLSRGYYIVAPSPSNHGDALNHEDAQASFKRHKEILATLRKNGFSKSGGFITLGSTAPQIFAFINSQPDACKVILSINPSAIDSELVIALSRRNKPLFLETSTPEDAIVLQRRWEQGPSPLWRYTIPKTQRAFLPLANHFLKRGDLMSYPRETYAHRHRFTPAYPCLSDAEIVSRFRKSGYGDRKIVHKGNAVYMNGHFNSLDKRWRQQLGLVRNKDGSLSGPTLVFNKAHGKTVKGNNKAPWGLAAGDLANISVKIIDVTRNEEDEKRMTALIRDLTELMARNIRAANDDPELNPRILFDAAGALTYSLKGLARVSFLVDSDDAEELGRLALIRLKDRWNLYPYQNMDLARATGGLFRILNIFRDDDTLLRFLKERSHYMENVICYSSAVTPEGLPQHHGLWHYSYGSYSFGSILEHVRSAHSIGLYLSQESYRRLIQAGIKGTALGLLCYFDNVVPFNYNARTGIHCSAGASGFGALTNAIHLGDGKSPDGLNPECLAYAEWAAPEDGILEQAREKNVEWKRYHPRLQQTINAGSMAVRQFGAQQVSVSCSSEWYRTWVEVYNIFGDAGYGMYSKLGSLYLRSPSRERAERYISRDGYNFSFTPGATSQVRSAQEIIYRGTTGKFHNASGIAGGVNMPALSGSEEGGTDGMLAMDANRGPAPLWYKSYFFFGNRITSLTSNIEPYRKGSKHAKGVHGYVKNIPHDDEHPLVTTLFQWKINSESAFPSVKPGIGVDIDADPARGSASLDDREDSIPLNDYKIGQDQFGNAWVIHPSPKATLHYRRGEQTYQFIRGQKLKPGVKIPFVGGLANTIRKVGPDKVIQCYEVGHGRWERSWIKHDLVDGSDQAGIAWTLLVRNTKTSPSKLVSDLKSSTPPYEIWRCDSTAHIVFDRDSKTTGYALFHPFNDPLVDPALYGDRPRGAVIPLSEKGYLVSASAPCFLMIRDENKNALTLSYANAMPQRSRRVILTLRGAWELNESYPHSDPATRVETIQKKNNQTEVHFILQNPEGKPSPAPPSTMIKLQRKAH